MQSHEWNQWLKHSSVIAKWMCEWTKRTFLLRIKPVNGAEIISIALLLNEVSEKWREMRNEISEMFSQICPDICPKIRSKISRSSLAGRKVLPPNFTRCFSSEISHWNIIPNQISPRISQHSVGGPGDCKSWGQLWDYIAGFRQAPPITAEPITLGDLGLRGRETIPQQHKNVIKEKTNPTPPNRDPWSASERCPQRNRTLITLAKIPLGTKRLPT